MSLRRGDHGELTATALARHITPQALWQQRQVRAGLCASCRGEAKAGRLCEGCAARDRVWRAAWVAARHDQGLCRCGLAREGDAGRCADCRARENRARAAKAKTGRR